jgi:hypothetical protein
LLQKLREPISGSPIAAAETDRINSQDHQLLLQKLREPMSGSPIAAAETDRTNSQDHQLLLQKLKRIINLLITDFCGRN